MKSPCPQHPHPHRLIQQPLSDLTEKLRRGELKITAPRQAILDVLRRHACPLTTKEIHRSLGKSDCDLATVYRNMHTLEGMGLVRRHDFGDGAARFELSSDEDEDTITTWSARGAPGSWSWTTASWATSRSGWPGGTGSPPSRTGWNSSGSVRIAGGPESLPRSKRGSVGHRTAAGAPQADRTPFP